jgi:hypothetical protein
MRVRPRAGVAALLWGALAGCSSSSSSDAVPECLEGVPPSELSEYARACDASGVFFVSSDAVPASARLAAARLLRTMAGGRADLLPALANGHTHVAILGEREETTSLSEWSALGTDDTQRKYWNTRARGFGATLAAPAALVPEEDVLCYPTGDQSTLGSISIHELAHTLHLVAMAQIDPLFNGRVEASYASAMAAGLWQQTYSTTDAREYFAQGMTAWFDAGCEASPANGTCNEVNTRAELITYDPPLAALVREVVGDVPPIAPCKVLVSAPIARSCGVSDAAPAIITLPAPANIGVGTGSVSGIIRLPAAPPAPPKDANAYVSLEVLTFTTDGRGTAGTMILPTFATTQVTYVVTGLPAGMYSIVVSTQAVSDLHDLWSGASGGATRDGTLVFANLFSLDATARCGVDVDVLRP